MPEVIEGQRGESARPGDRSISDPYAILDRGNGEYVVFHSRYRYLNLILSAKKDAFVNGEMIQAENPRIQFSDYALRLHRKDDSELVARLMRDKRFGLDGFFWLPEMREIELADRQVESVIAQMKDPGFVEAFKRKAGAQDFGLLTQVMDVLTSPAMDTPIPKTKRFPGKTIAADPAQAAGAGSEDTI